MLHFYLKYDIEKYTNFIEKYFGLNADTLLHDIIERYYDILIEYRDNVEKYNDCAKK